MTQRTTLDACYCHKLKPSFERMPIHQLRRGRRVRPLIRFASGTCCVAANPDTATQVKCEKCEENVKTRVIGSLIGAVLGFVVGGGTGIVGGIFGAVAGVLVFTAIGAVWGWSAGPDFVQAVQRWRNR